MLDNVPPASGRGGLRQRIRPELAGLMTSSAWWRGMPEACVFFGNPLPDKEPIFQQPPFGAVGNFDQGPVDWLFERTMLRERDGHIGGR